MEIKIKKVDTDSLNPDKIIDCSSTPFTEYKIQRLAESLKNYLLPFEKEADASNMEFTLEYNDKEVGLVTKSYNDSLWQRINTHLRASNEWKKAVFSNS